MKKYFFILGRIPELSKAEILAVLEKEKVKYKITVTTDQFFVISTENELRINELALTLAGTIKIGEIIGTEKKINEKALIKYLQKKDSKLYFGISSYNTSCNINQLGKNLKQELKESNISARFVSSKENPLSSIIVAKNKLLTNGSEIVILKYQDENLIGQTKAVQPFELFSSLDFGRPSRNTYKGMLPPKLAQIMINLAGINKNQKIYDPFCGSGTILQQAFVLGYQYAIGSDSDEKQIIAAKNNLQWLSNKFNKENNYRVYQANVTEKLNATDISAIVTEPYLGPPLKGNETYKNIIHNVNNLTKLYKQAFRNFDKILNKNGTIIIVMPKFYSRHKYASIPIQQILPKTLTIIDKWDYSRPNQKIIREIYKIKKS